MQPKKEFQEELENRILQEARYFIEAKSTVRETAKKFKCSKSTIYRHLTYVLISCSPNLAQEVKEIMDVNKSERSFRGGESTKRKYLLLRG